MAIQILLVTFDELDHDTDRDWHQKLRVVAAKDDHTNFKKLQRGGWVENVLQVFLRSKGAYNL